MIVLPASRKSFHRRLVQIKLPAARRAILYQKRLHLCALLLYAVCQPERTRHSCTILHHHHPPPPPPPPSPPSPAPPPSARPEHKRATTTPLLHSLPAGRCTSFRSTCDHFRPGYAVSVKEADSEPPHCAPPFTAIVNATCWEARTLLRLQVPVKVSVHIFAALDDEIAALLDAEYCTAPIA